MSKRIKYSDEPLGRLRVIPDFLPDPKELAFREEGVKITLALSKRSVDFFKQEAARMGTRYQRMIRRLVDAYVEHHLTKKATPRLKPAARGRRKAR